MCKNSRVVIPFCSSHEEYSKVNDYGDLMPCLKMIPHRLTGILITIVSTGHCKWVALRNKIKRHFSNK